MAKAHALLDQSNLAIEILEKVIQKNPLALDAYDALSDIYRQQNDTNALQAQIKRSTRISPNSILRQKALAHSAEANEDTECALHAALATVKLGEKSSLFTTDDAVKFLKISGDALKKGISVKNLDLVEKCRIQAKKIKNNLNSTPQQKSQSNLLTARIFQISGNTSKAEALISEENLEHLAKTSDVFETQEALFFWYESTGDIESQSSVLNQIEQQYCDETIPHSFDPFRPHPKLDKNRNQVAELNKKGIKLYQQGQYHASTEWFRKSEKSYPQHLGIKLNKMQSLIKQILLEYSSELLIELSETCDFIERRLKQTNNAAHLARFEKLKILIEGISRAKIAPSTQGTIHPSKKVG